MNPYFGEGILVEQENLVVGVANNHISTVLNGVDHTHSSYELQENKPLLHNVLYTNLIHYTYLNHEQEVIFVLATVTTFKQRGHAFHLSHTQRKQDHFDLCR